MSANDPVHGSDAERWGGWSWREPSRGEHFRRCSYCGSIHPDDLVSEALWRAEWADQKYGWPHKFYVNIPNRDPAAMFVVSACNSTRHGVPKGAVLTADLTDEHRVILERGNWKYGADSADGYVQFGTRAHHFGKFYTIHLADPAISAETKASVEFSSGLRFTFDSGRVKWGAVQYG